MEFNDPTIDVIGSFEDFMPPHVDSFEEESIDNVDSSIPITRKEHHLLNEKVDSLLAQTNTFSIMNFKNMVNTHKATMETRRSRLIVVVRESVAGKVLFVKVF